MRKLKQTLIKQKSENLVQEVDSRDVNFIRSYFLGSLLVVLSGAVMYLDKAISFLNINIEIPTRYEDHYYDLETFLWVLSVVISPLLLIIAAHLKTYKPVYVIPLFVYSLQLWFIFYDIKIVDRGYLGWYAAGTTLLIVASYIAYKRYEKISILKELTKAQSELDNI
jgi:hypothetical protein